MPVFNNCIDNLTSRQGRVQRMSQVDTVRHERTSLVIHHDGHAFACKHGADCREHLRKRTAKHKRCLHECINGIHTRAVGRWLHSLDAGSNRARRASHASRSFAAVAALGPLVSMDTVHTANRSALGSWEASRAFASVTTRIQEQYR